MQLVTSLGFQNRKHQDPQWYFPHTHSHPLLSSPLLLYAIFNLSFIFNLIISFFNSSIQKSGEVWGRQPVTLRPCNHCLRRSVHCHLRLRGFRSHYSEYPFISSSLPLLFLSLSYYLIEEKMLLGWRNREHSPQEIASISTTSPRRSS